MMDIAWDSRHVPARIEPPRTPTGPDVFVAFDRPSLPDKRVVQCNYREATAECRAGARAYVLQAHVSNHRAELLAKSRSGRWIRKWENIRRLTDFRHKTMPPDHTLYSRVWEPAACDDLQWLNDLSREPLGPEE